MAYKIASIVAIDGDSNEEVLDKLKDLTGKICELLVNEGYSEADDGNVKSIVAVNTLEGDFQDWIGQEVQGAFLVVVPAKEGDEISVGT